MKKFSIDAEFDIDTAIAFISKIFNDFGIKFELKEDTDNGISTFEYDDTQSELICSNCKEKYKNYYKAMKYKIIRVE